MPTTRVTQHQVTAAASPDRIFDLLADLAGWPQVFGAIVHAEVVERDGAAEVLRIWGFAGGAVRTWLSRRTLDRPAGRMTLQRLGMPAPVAAMGADWYVQGAGEGQARVTLRHCYQVVDDGDAAAVQAVARTVAASGEADLASVRGVAELAFRAPESTFSFHDSLAIRGTPQKVYEFLEQAERWPGLLPHVLAARVTREGHDVQFLALDTRGAGVVHTSLFVRVGFPRQALLVEKRLSMPPLIAGHTGRWTALEDDGVTTATSWQTVTLDPAGVRRVLGEETALAGARTMVRHALGTNSTAVLRSAKAYAER